MPWNCRSCLIALTTLFAFLGSTHLLAASPSDGKGARILMVTQSKGFKHGVVNRGDQPLSLAERTLTELGISSNLFRVHCTQDVAKDFTKENLANYDIVFFYTTGDLPIESATRDWFFSEWVKQKGHGVVGTHSATDTFHNYEPYWDMIGGTFDGHPWNANETVTITVHDPAHPSAKPWGTEFSIQDEIYQFYHWQPEKVRVLMSLNMEKTKLKKPRHIPISWVKDYEQGGRVFYISLGHRDEVWQNPTYHQSLLGGIKWVLGLEPGDATPNPQLSQQEQRKAEQASDKAAKAEVDGLKAQIDDLKNQLEAAKAK